MASLKFICSMLKGTLHLCNGFLMDILHGPGLVCRYRTGIENIVIGG
jgi:hypothetical protein